MDVGGGGVDGCAGDELWLPEDCVGRERCLRVLVGVVLGGAATRRREGDAVVA